MALSPHRVCLGFEADVCITPRSVLPQDRPVDNEQSPSMLSKALSRRKQRPVSAGSQGGHLHLNIDQGPSGQRGFKGAAIPAPEETPKPSTRPRSACVDIPRSPQRSPTCSATLDEYEQEAVVAAALHCHTPLTHLSHLPGGGCRGSHVTTTTGRHHSPPSASPPDCCGACSQPMLQPQGPLLAAPTGQEGGFGSRGSGVGDFEAAAGGQGEPSATGRLFEAQAEAASAKALAQCLLDSLRQERERAEWLLSQLGRVSQERDRLQRELLTVQGGTATLAPAGAGTYPQRHLAPPASSAMPSSKGAAGQGQGRGRRSKAAARQQLQVQPQKAGRDGVEEGRGGSSGAGALVREGSGGIRPRTPAASHS